MSAATGVTPRRGARRSVLAVVAGVAVILVVTTAVDVVLHVAGVFPPMGVPLDDRLSLIAVSYRIVISIGGAYLTASLAPAAPMRHALVLGLVGTVLGVVGVAVTWGKGLGPSWYPISLAVLALPQCWVGGKLSEMARGRRSPRTT